MRKDHVLFLLFVLSGFCGLLYQIVWMRMAFAAFGVITPVLSLVVSVFMLGLTVGSWVGGRLITGLTRRSGRSAIWYYSAVELVIGLGGLLVPVIFRAGERALLPLGAMDSGPYLLWSALVLTLSILPFCVAMGTTYPLMLAFVKERDAANTTSFRFLYLGNVIGAMAGTLLTAACLIEWLGFRHTLLVAAFTNFTIAGIGAGLGRRYPLPAGGPPPEVVAAAAAPATRSSPLLATILFGTGFLSMAMEVVWTRAFTPVLRTTIYSFAALLTMYLLATWIGSLLYRRHLAARRSWGVPALLGGLAVSSFLPLLLNDPRIHAGFVGRIILVLSSIAPFCALLGYLTPKLIDDYAQGQPKAAGTGYAINVVGCIIGPLFAGYLLLPLGGVKLALLLLAAPFILFLVPYARAVGARVLAPLAASALLLAGSFFARTYEDPAFYGAGSRLKRDHVATTIAHGTGFHRILLVNGVGMTFLTPICKTMAHLPMAIHPEARHAANICFGMGTTFRSLTSWPDLQTVAVELVPSVPEVFDFFHADAAAVVQRPNGKIVVDDGRRYLKRTDQKFDLITLDPPPPVEAAGSSLLYTREFLDVIKSRMNSNAILQHWIPGGEKLTVQAVARTLADAFPHIRVYTSLEDVGYHFTCSMQPFEVPDAATFASRLPPAAHADFVEWSGELDARAYAQEILRREIPLERILADAPLDIRVTDDRPYSEYFFVRRAWNKLTGKHASLH
jgi:spermidine synthase